MTISRGCGEAYNFAIRECPERDRSRPDRTLTTTMLPSGTSMTDRDKTSADNQKCRQTITPDHDAEPAARARTDADRERTDKPCARPGEGAGNTQKVSLSASFCAVFPVSRKGKTMPIATLRFTLPDEEYEFRTAQQGSEAKLALWDIDQHLRSLCKWGEPSEETRRLAEEIRAMIPGELLED